MTMRLTNQCLSPKLSSRQRVFTIMGWPMVLALLIGTSIAHAQSPAIDSLKIQLATYQKQDTVRVELLLSAIYEIYTSDTGFASGLLEESYTLAEKLGYEKGRAETVYFRGHVARRKSDYPRALSYYGESLKLYEAIGLKKGVSLSLNAMGIVYYNLGESAKALRYYERSMAIDQELGDQDGVASCQTNIANIYADNGDYDKALTYYTAAKETNEALGDMIGVALAFANVGSIYAEQGQFPKALESFNKALGIYETYGQMGRGISLLGDVGSIYMEYDEPDKAMRFFQKGLGLSRKQGNKKLIARFLNKVGDVYEKKQQYAKALEAYQEALAINRQIGQKRNIAVSLSGMGDIRIAQRQYDQALQYYQEALALNTAADYQQGLHHATLGMGTIMRKKGLYKQALAYALRGDSIAHRLSSLEFKKQSAQLLSTIYNSMGRYKRAFDYHKKYKAYADSLFNKPKILKIAQLEYDYKYRLKLDSANQRELALAKKIKLADADLAASRQQKLLAIIGVLALAIVLGVSIFMQRIRNIKSTNQNILMEQKLLRTQMTPHFIFNALSVLQGIILNKETKKAVVYLSKFSRLLRITLENSRDKTVLLENELKAVEHYVAVQNLGADIPYQFSIDIGENIEQAAILVPPMMIQPFVENAIEHAFEHQAQNREVALAMRQDENKLTCTITDNGVGIEAGDNSKSRNKKSLATIITAERLKMLSHEFKISANISIKDRKHLGQKGTEVRITLPFFEL